ncbi:hypothetical protein ACTFIV_001082 [Dictyostelium citrinum]
MKILLIFIFYFIYFIKLNKSAPVLFERYSWSTLNNINSLVLTGTGFDYSSNNSAIINNVESVCSVAIASTTIQGYDQITCPSSVTLSIVADSPMIVAVKSNGQTSNVRSWYLINPISMTLRQVVTLGQKAQFNGVFTTKNLSIVTISIDGSQCSVDTATPSYLVFLAPYKPKKGQYDFILEIGGLQYKANITYVDSGQPVLDYQYSWTTSPNGKTYLTIYGYHFTHYYYNIIILNGIEYNATAAVGDPGQLEMISLLDDEVTNSIQNGDMFSINVKVAGQISIFPKTFQKIPFISFNESTPLLDIGGYIVFNGSFGYGTLSVDFIIDTQFVQVLNTYPTWIGFNYYPKTNGTYSYKLNIGGLQLVGKLTYIQAPYPTLKKYEPVDGGKLVLYGKWFGILVQNDIIINNGSAIIDAIPNQILGFDTLTFTPNVLLSIGDRFSVEVHVMGRSSNIGNFVYIQSISMETQTLNTTGGIATFSGSFTVSDIQYITLLIDGVQCDVKSVSPTQITFRYPPIVSGEYSMLINIGGFENSTTVKFTTPPSPTVKDTYKWSDDGVIIFKGTYFSYVNENYLIINGDTYNATLVLDDSEKVNYDQITFVETISPSSILQDGQEFTVKVSTGGLISNRVTFIYNKAISINSQEIYSVDGIGSEFTTISGLFSTLNKTIVSLYIELIEFNITSIEAHSINFSHDVNLNLGENDLLLNIGGLEYKTTINVIEPPKPILLNNYNWLPNDILVLKGSNFNYKSPNKVSINEIIYNSTLAKLNIDKDEITFDNNSSTSSFTIGQSFTVYINNGVEDSNSITFIHLKSISITTQTLNNTGGQVTFSGEYHVSNTTLVLLLIDDSTIKVTDITPNTISFNYPAKPIGEYNLIINIGGFEYSTTVQYITTPTSPSPSPSPSPSTGTQTTGTKPDLSDESLSISSRLSTSFITCLLFLLFSFFAQNYHIDK